MKAVTSLPGGQLAVVEGELLDLDKRAKHGDPTAGWRGDETFHIFTYGPFVEVRGLDREDNVYVACVVDSRKPGWKHEALARLVRGDWQRGDAWERIDAENQRLDRARQAVLDEQFDAAAEKLQWGLRRDLGEGRPLSISRKVS